MTSTDVHPYSSHIPNIPRTDIYYNPLSLGTPSQRPQCGNPSQHLGTSTYAEPQTRFTGTNFTLSDWFGKVLPIWDIPTHQADPFLLPERQFIPSTTIDALDTGQTAPATEPIRPHSSHTSPFATSDSSTDFAVRLLRPRPTQGRAVVLPRIETHVYLNIDLQPYWNAIQIPLTKSVARDDSSSTGKGIKPLQLVIIVRGATTRQECNYVCERCQERVGNKKGPVSLIDFHSPSNILTPKNGVVQIHVTFSCYSRHHREEDTEYMYVAVEQYRCPDCLLTFVFKSRSDPQRRKQTL